MVNFNYGTGSPAPGLPEDYFSIRWRGKIIPSDTVHHLGFNSDDGGRLYVNGKLLIDDWTDHEEMPHSADVTLLPGKEYDIEFDYYDDALGAVARLMWDIGQKDFRIVKEIAAKNDLVVLVVGTSPGISREELDRYGNRIAASAAGTDP